MRFPCVVRQTRRRCCPFHTREENTLDCGGTTPLLLHAWLAPAGFEFTAALALPTVQEKRGHVPAVRSRAVLRRGAHDRILRCRINAAFRSQVERRIYAAERGSRRNLFCALRRVSARK